MLVWLTSCDEFLEINPNTQLSEEEFYKTEEQVMMGLYDIMNEVQVRLMEIHSSCALLSDEVVTGGEISSDAYKVKWDNFTFDASGAFGEWGYGSWWNEWDHGIYDGVMAATIVVDKVNASGLNESFVRAIDAEARFYRALFYYYIFMGYEQFPLITKILSVEDMYTVGKSTRQEAYEFMLSDLADNVIQYLPERQFTLQGRICRDAAKILRTKIILFHRDESHYQLALNDMNEIIGSHRYELDPDYLHIWLKDGEWKQESIYEIAFAGNNSGEGCVILRGVGGRSIVDPRSAEQGGLMHGYGELTMSYDIYNMFDPDDRRREGTVIVYANEIKKVQEMVISGELAAGSRFEIDTINQANAEGLGHYKYHPRKETSTPIDPLNNYFASFRMFRYADVLLLGAELDVRINGNATISQGWFDLVRDRAFGNTAHRISLNQGKQTNLDILFKERRYEFTDEMQRWFDIMRFDKGDEVLGPNAPGYPVKVNGITQRVGNKGWVERYRYFPIDQSEIDKSKGNLTQNPGWL
jgi:hypothetical protein